MKGTEAMAAIRDEMAAAKDDYVGCMGELKELRKKAMAAPNEQVVLLRKSYGDLVEQFKDIKARILGVEATEPEIAAKYRAAVAMAARKMAEELEA